MLPLSQQASRAFGFFNCCTYILTTAHLAQIDIIEHNDASSAMKRTLIENVQDAIADMVALIKTYRSMKRITQVVVSTLFKRRMEETEAVIDQTFADLMVSF